MPQQINNSKLSKYWNSFLSHCNLGCSDADWASDTKDRRSISGFCFFFQFSLISWSAVKQRAIALSSTEAEYYALTHAFKEALWLRVFLTLLSLPIPHLFPLFSNNQAAISLSSSLSISSRSKHIDIRHHFLRSHISDGSFSITWIPTTDMPADIFTKSLPDTVFSRHRSVLNLVIAYLIMFVSLFLSPADDVSTPTIHYLRRYSLVY